MTHDNLIAADKRRAIVRANLEALVRRGEQALVNAICEVLQDLKLTVLVENPPVLKICTASGEILLNDAADQASQARLLDDIKVNLNQGDAIMFGGLGNGQWLETIFSNQPKLFLGMLNPFYVVEPRLEVFAANLLLRDWTRLIEAENVFFFMGPQCSEQFIEFALANPAKPLPTRVILSSSSAPTNFQDIVSQANAQREQELTALSERIRQYYEKIPPQRFAELCSSTPPRRPRVYLITTLFSTVLQYATRDIADAFAQLGWDTKIDIENDVCDRVSLLKIAQDIWQFKPDLVFQIDHARFEAFYKILPQPLPFITWIQDRMPQLYSKAAGKKLGPTDLVFTIGSGEEFQANYDYPGDRLFYLPMAANSRMFSASPPEDSEPQIVYVSHTSKTPEMLLDELEPVWEKYDSPAIRASLSRAMKNILAPAQEACDRGNPLIFEFQWRELFNNAIRQEGLAITNSELQDHLVNFALVKLGNAMYRHQTLQWAADSGLPLRVYGSGWEHHPVLSKFAVGVVKHGPDLAEVYHRARINLQAVITCNVHQRVFEGIWAGGFFLLRDHPGDRAPLIVACMLEWLTDQQGRPIDEVINSPELTNEQRLILRFLEGRWLGRFEALDDRALDLLKHYGSFKGLVGFLGSAIDEAYFRNAHEFAEKANFYFEHPKERREIILAMQSQLKSWEMTHLLRRRLNDVHHYLAGLAPSTVSR